MFGFDHMHLQCKNTCVLAYAKVQCVGQYCHDKVLLNIVMNMTTLMLLKHQTNIFFSIKMFLNHHDIGFFL